MKVFSLFALLIIWGCVSCSSDVLTVEEYYAWQEEEANGVHKTKSVGDLQFDLKLLAPEYLTYLELKNDKNMDQRTKDSIAGLYKPNLSFVLTIGPVEDAKNKFDITSVGVADYDEYSERMKTLNFGLAEMLELRAGDKSWKPALVEMENIYGMAFHRKFNIVFTPEERLDELTSLEKFRVTFQDDIFNTGTTSFGFLKSAIDKTPAITY